MKKLIVSILAFLLFSIGAYSQCFTPVWSEPSQDSMLIYVSMASLNGSNLQVGDEIGVFDREECVGVGVLTQELTGAPIYLVIEVSRQRPGSPGFSPGNTILYRFCSGGEVANPAVIPTYISNGPNFSANDSCVVELRAINTAPVVTSIPDTVALEDVLYSSSITALDIDGDSLIYTAPRLPAWLSFNDTTQVLSGIPLNDDVGYDTVTLRIFDGLVTLDTTFAIRVANVNDAPTITSVPDTVANQDLLYISSISAADIDIGDSLIYSAPILPQWLSFNDTTQILSGTPLNNDVGDNPVTLRVSDGTVNVDTSFVIHVGNINDPPAFTSIPDTITLEDVFYNDTIAAVDIDGDSLIYSAILLPTWLIFNDTTQVLTGTPVNEDVGDHPVSFRVSDGLINVDTSFIIHVLNVNDAPTFTLLPDTTALEDALYSSSIIADDMDGDTLTFAVPLLPAWLSFNDTTNVLSGTPVNDHVGDHPVILRINDGTVNVDSSFIIHVLNVNDAPFFTSIQDTTGLQGALYSYTATAEDVDIGDTLTFSAPVLPIWLSFDTTTHILSGTPDNDAVGDNSVVLMISDGTVDLIQDFIIEVENVNDPPTVTSDPVTEARPGVAYSYTVTAEDIDGDDLIYTALVLPGWLVFNESTHTLAATPGEGDVGDQHVTIRISDGLLHEDHTFVITVDNGNHAPTFSSDPETSIVVGNNYVYTITAQDIDSDPLSYTAPVLPDWLTFFPETHVISGVPQSGDLGRHDVTLRVSDGTVSADQIFYIFVENVNTVPSFISTPLTSVSAGDLYVYIAEAEDADGDELSYSAITLPSWLNFDVNTQNLHGAPTNDDAGDHNVTLRVTDGKGAQNQNFVITVDFVYGVEELSSEEGILVYPNPSTGVFFVELSRELDKEVILEIMDPLGRILKRREFPANLLINEAFNLSDRPAGIYFIRVYDNSYQSVKKLMIH
jgi:hypothetical protein